MHLTSITICPGLPGTVLVHIYGLSVTVIYTLFSLSKLSSWHDIWYDRSHSGSCVVSSLNAQLRPGVGPLPTFTSFSQRCSKLGISMLTHQHPLWTELFCGLHHDSPPPGSTVPAYYIPTSHGDGQRKGRIFSSPLSADFSIIPAPPSKIH